MAKKKTKDQPTSVLGKMSFEEFVKQKARKVHKLRGELAAAKENLSQVRKTLDREESMTFQGISDGYQMSLDFGCKPDDQVATERGAEHPADDHEPEVIDEEAHGAEGGKRQAG